MKVLDPNAGIFETKLPPSPLSRSQSLCFFPGMRQIKYTQISLKNPWAPGTAAIIEVATTDDGSEISNALIQRLQADPSTLNASPPIVLDRPVSIQSHGSTIEKRHAAAFPGLARFVDLAKFKSTFQNGVFFLAEEGMMLSSRSDTESALILDEKPYGLIGYWPSGALGQHWKQTPPAGLQKGRDPYSSLDNYLITADSAGLGLNGIIARTCFYLNMEKQERFAQQEKTDFDIFYVKDGGCSLHDLLQFLHDRKIIYSDVRISCCRDGGHLLPFLKEQWAKFAGIRSPGEITRFVLHERCQKEAAHRKDMHKKLGRIHAEMQSLDLDHPDDQQKYSELEVQYIHTASRRDSLKDKHFFETRQRYSEKLGRDLERLEERTLDDVDYLPELMKRFEDCSQDESLRHFIQSEHLEARIENLKKQKKISDELKDIFHSSL